MLRQRDERRHLLLSIFNDPRATEDHHRTIVHRVMKRRPREHQTIDDRHRHTRIETTRQRTQHSTSLRAVDVELVINTGVTSRDHERLTLRRKPDVTDKPLVQNSVDSFAIEMTALGEALELRAFGLEKCHDCKYAIDSRIIRNLRLETQPSLRRRICAFDCPWSLFVYSP